MQAVTGGSHVPRAVLATAAEFGDVSRSIAEYIWNSFEYRRDKGAPAIVKIRFGKDRSTKWFEVEDFANGAGMDLSGLQRFFTMHAPNENRLRGDAGRGRNGTGKAAAFGVGSELTVYTVRNGIENEFRLQKHRLEELESVYPCESLPLEHVIEERQVLPTSPQYGTRIRVSGIGFLTDEDAVVRNLTRLFMRVLDYNELWWEMRPGKFIRVVREAPPTVLQHEYESPAALAPQIGQVVLHLAATEYELPKPESGVIVTSVGGAVFETGYMNVSKRRTVVDKRILGHIDVPLLDLPDSQGRLATTQARRLQMNRESERVEALLPWLDECLDRFKQDVEVMLQSSIDEKDRGILDAISGTLEHVLNQQYERFMKDYSVRMKLPKASPLAPLRGEGTPDGMSPTGGVPTDTLDGERVFSPDPEGTANMVKDPDGDIQVTGPGRDGGKGGGAPGNPSTARGRLDDAGKPAKERSRGPKEARGGRSLRVAYLGLGASSPRSYFDGEGTFTINQDHPDFLGLEKTDTEFMRRSAEACAVTYAEAVVEMRIKDGDPTVAESREALSAYLEEHDKILRPLIAACPNF
jgi:hypothetical protein